MRLSWPMFAALLPLLSTAARVDAAVSGDPLAQHYAAVRASLDPRARSALDRIDGFGRQLLAMRAYVRADGSLAARWSWTEPQIAAWSGSLEEAALDAQIIAVRRAFEAANPGHSLYVNPQVRSLDVQLQRWNANASVAKAGDALVSSLRSATQASGFPAPGSGEAAARFAAVLREHVPHPIPTLAAPGLSAHGRMGAVDFQVVKGHRVVAGPESAHVADVWIGHGWRDRLKAAVQAAGNHFAGPLASPVEPWHYDYEP